VEPDARSRGSGPEPVPAPGSTPKKGRRPRITWELIACGLHGHHLVGTEAATVTPADHMVVRVFGSERWYRCLRCDTWMPLPAPEHPAVDLVPGTEETEVPLRGKPLRDLYVLRIIAVERAAHILLLGLLAMAVFLFASHRRGLRTDYTRVLSDLQQDLGGPVGHNGILSVLNRLFAVSAEELYLIGTALIVYCVLLGAEAIGLWMDRRWAEYLTFVETSVLVPYEIYELINGVTVLKLLTLGINLTILLYLAYAHRLFGWRGGISAIRARRADATGWATVARATPPFS
jgi:uncharacterized membrane protein (DUF2068 family)